MTEASARNPLLKPSLTFVLLVVGAMLLSVIPIVSLPFSWTATFFHEISHGLMAIATGGSIVKINLYPNGAGLCTSIGGSPFLIAFAGYFGAVLWGVLIYKSVDQSTPKAASVIAVVLAGLILLSLVLWARDVITIAILGSILVVFVAVIRMRRVYGIQLALRFIAIYVLLRAIRAPLALLDGTDFGDGAALSNLTGVPEFLWVFIWFSVGIGGLAHLWKQQTC